MRHIVIILLLLIMGSQQILSNTIKEKFIVPNEHLIISNFPEEIYEPGNIFIKKIESDSVRVLYHHENISNKQLAICISIRNRGNTDADIYVTQSNKGPSKDEMYVGHVASKTFLEELFNESNQKQRIPAGQTKQLAWNACKPNQIVAGILKVAAPTNNKNLILQMRVIDTRLAQLSGLNETLGNEKTKYGYFLQANRTIVKEFNSEAPVMEIGIGSEPFLLDKNSGIELQGNYGLIYNIYVLLINNRPGFRCMNLYYSSLGGVSRGTFFVNGKLYETSRLKTEMNDPEKICEFILEPKETRKINIITMPEPGSFYPANLILQNSITGYCMDFSFTKGYISETN